MATQNIPLYIPTYIGSITYQPARVLPRLFFWNGLVQCQPFYLQGYQFGATNNYYETQFTNFPYFDNYNVVTGSFPTTNSKSLLFNNENAAYGEIPTDNLYTDYWETYISLLYNPRTRLVNCSAIIPLADYFDMELNDVVEWRGNVYHLRAINDYSIKDGSCTLQLLGPIIADTFSDKQPEPIPPTGSTAYATASIYLSEYNASPTAFIDANLIVSGTAYYFSGNFSQSISGGTVTNVTMEGKDAGSTVWGPYTTASATLTTLDNGTPITSSTQYIYSGSGDVTITFPTTFTAGHNITISGSTAVIAAPTCCTPTITSVTASGGNTIDVYFTTGSVCSACTATTIQSSLDNSTWGNNNTAGCGSPRTITAPTSSTYYRMYETCTSATSSFSNSVLFATGSGNATLSWTYSVTGGPSSNYMYIYVNGSIVESRSNTASGNYTVYVGDQIYVDIGSSGCSGGSDKANAYCGGLIVDSACGTGITSLSSTTYTVVSVDIGNVLHLDSFASCDGGCI